MKKVWKFVVVAAFLTLAGLVPNAGSALAEGSWRGRKDRQDLKDFAGNWGCSFSSPVSFFGPVAGLITLSIQRSGEVVGHETVATADPFVLLEIEVTGGLVEGPSGTVDGTLTLRNPSFPDQTGKIKCVGTVSHGGDFQVMSCLDINDEPGGDGGGGPSTDQIALVRCERQ